MTGSTTGRVARMLGGAGARFTGASASLKGVSGESTRGTADTYAAAANRTRTKSRFTLPNPKSD